MNITGNVLSICLAAPLTVGALFIIPTAVSAEQNGDYMYEIKAGGTAKITEYRGIKAEENVPAQIGGKRVTSIGDYAISGFYSHPRNGYKYREPDGGVEIGSRAFSSSFTA